MLFLVKLHPAFLYTRFVGHFFSKIQHSGERPIIRHLIIFGNESYAAIIFDERKVTRKTASVQRPSRAHGTVSKRTTSGVLRLARKHGTIIRIKAITYYWLQSRDDFSVEFVLIFVLRRKLLYFFCQTNYRHGPKYHE